VTLEFDFILRTPGEKLAVRIDDLAEGRCVFHSVLSGERRALTDARLAWYLIKHPLLTLRVIFLIHWQALLLWLRRVPYFAKATHPDRQTSLYRPHASIKQAPTA
jgi:hypothetical protein